MGTSLKDRLLGSWQLESFYLQKEVGDPIYWWGHDVVGRITFDEKGRFAAQVGRREFARTAGAVRERGEPDRLCHGVEW